MFSKKIVIGIMLIALFLSISALITNMPEKKNKRVYSEIVKFFPYEFKKKIAGIDIVDKRTGKDLGIANSKVFLAFDDMLKKWAKTHLELKNNHLIIYDDKHEQKKEIKLNTEEKKWVLKFFYSPQK